MKVKSNFGNIICEARKNKRLTQQELAEKIFVTDKAISNWENNKNIPDEEMLKKLEEILEVELLEKEQINKVKIIIQTTIIILLITVFTILLTYTLNNYNRFKIYEISLDSSSYILKDSNITITPNEIFINTGELKNNELPYQPQYNVELYYKNNKNEEVYLSKAKSYNYFQIQLNNSKSIKKNLLNNLYIKIEYKDYDGKTISEVIKVNLLEKINNNKLFYNKQETEEIDQASINLLKNNGYNKINNNEYEKQYDEDYYKFNIHTKELFYKGQKDNIDFYAIERENERYTYAIIENNKIIEYHIQGSSSGKKYNEIIQTKMKEINKLSID